MNAATPAGGSGPGSARADGGTPAGGPLRPRLLFVLPNLSAGGAERTVLNLAAALADEAEVHVALVSHRGALLSEVPDTVQVHGLGGRAAVFVALPRLVRRLRPVSVLSTLWDMNIIVAGLHRWYPRDTRVVLREALLTATSFSEYALPWLIKRLHCWAYPRADAVVVLTREMAERLTTEFEVPGQRVHVVNNAVAPERLCQAPGIEPRPESAVVRLMSMGRLTRQKGYDVLLESIAKVRASLPAIELVLCGDGPERSRLEQMIESHALHDCVTLPGYCTDPLERLARTDLYVMCSRYEGLSNAMLEALCCGVPLLATTEQTGAAEFIDEGRNGFLVERCTVSELAPGLCRAVAACRSLDRRAIMVDARERFSLRHQVDQYRALLLGGS